MFVDIWIVCLFSLLFGVCAWWNYRTGVTKGVETTLQVLQDQKIIRINDSGITPYKKEVL